MQYKIFRVRRGLTVGFRQKTLKGYNQWRMYMCRWMTESQKRNNIIHRKIRKGIIFAIYCELFESKSVTMRQYDTFFFIFCSRLRGAPQASELLFEVKRTVGVCVCLLLVNVWILATTRNLFINITHNKNMAVGIRGIVGLFLLLVWIGKAYSQLRWKNDLWVNEGKP